MDTVFSCGQEFNGFNNQFHFHDFNDLPNFNDLDEQPEPSSVKSERRDGCIVLVSNIPYEAIDKDLEEILESILGVDSILSCKIITERNSCKSRGFGFVRFKTKEFAIRAMNLAEEGVFKFGNFCLSMRLAKKKKRQRPMYNVALIRGMALHLGCFVSHDTLHVLWSSKGDVKTEIEYKTRKFRFLLKYNGRIYKMEWHFRDVQQIDAWRIEGSKARFLLIQVWVAPQVYRQIRSEIPTILGRELRTKPVWSRTTDFTVNGSIGQSFAFCAEIPAVGNKVLVGEFQKLSNFQLGSNYLRDAELKLVYGLNYSTCQTLLHFLCSPYIDKLPFDLAFDVNYLVQSGYLSGPTLGHRFYKLLQPSVTPIAYTELAMESLLRMKETCYNPLKWFQKKITEFQKAKKVPNSTRIKLDEGQMYIRRIMVTPCKVYCLAPEIHDSNRVTRHFKDSNDDFLRVSFVEEDQETLASTALLMPSRGSMQEYEREKFTEVYDRIRSVLQKGVAFGGKRFEFLAFSSSQLRESSLWMFASNKRVTANNIRRWMGDFRNIRNVAKCAARMGQSFGSSTESLDVKRIEVEHIPDIENHIGGVKYCFSDGIGKISSSFAFDVARKCVMRKLGNRVPSAFQIRYGGYKGVVAVDPKSSYKLSLRPSMNKFPSKRTCLDILNWTHFMPCYLNRQIINLLSTLGIPDSVFGEMQNEVMAHLNQVLQKAEVALEILQMFSASDSHKLMVDMLKEGYHPNSEPFLKGMLSAFRANQLINLRKKARIFVPKGRLLMGCLDETATLAYGEVFVKVSATPEPHLLFSDGIRPVHVHEIDGVVDSGVVEGKLVVAKNPCMHPGDIRILHAIDVPELHHMVDCIVFPQRGPRPHTDECSGGDLDGDLYFVSWDERLIPLQEHEPMKYDAVPEEKLSHDVTIQEIQEYFVNYMANDNLGILSSAHTMFSDLDPDKALGSKCLEIAGLFSKAVDFAKTGVPVVISKDLQPTKYPDFMEKDNMKTYKSERILGSLYRAVSEISEEHSLCTFTREDACRFYDKGMEVSGFHHYVESALIHKILYDAKVFGLMNQYEIKSEADLLMGNAINLSGHYQKRPRTVKERIQNAVSSLKKEARNWFEEECQEIQSGDQKELARASAWYYVTYHPNYVDLQCENKSDYVHLLSFPWVISDKLLSIKRQRRSFQGIN